MTRRSLFRMLGGAAAAYVAPLPQAAPPFTAAMMETVKFNPVAYMGNYTWIHIGPAEYTARFIKKTLDSPEE